MLNMAFIKAINDQHLFKLLLGPLQTFWKHDASARAQKYFQVFRVLVSSYTYTYGKANFGLSPDVENAAIGYLLACKHKIQKWLNNLVCSKQNSADQSSKDFNRH